MIAVSQSSDVILCQFVHGLSFQKWPQFEATSCANSAKKEQSREGAIKSAQDQNARGIRLFRPQIQKSPQIKDLRVYVRGGRRGIRTLDALNGHAAFPGRYNQPLCHPSAVSVLQIKLCVLLNRRMRIMHILLRLCKRLTANSGQKIRFVCLRL